MTAALRSVPAKSPDRSKRARFVRLTLQGDKMLLKVGSGDHTTDDWEIDPEQLRGIILDGLPELLRFINCKPIRP